MFDDDMFSVFPDMDGDGDKDIVDVLILDEIDNEIQKEIDDRHSSRSSSFTDDWDIDFDSDVDPEDFDTEEEYLEVVEEKKHAWRDLALEGIELGIDPDDYETEEEYNDAVEEARYAWRENVEDGTTFGIDPSDYETEDEYLYALNASRQGAEITVQISVDDSIENKELYAEVCRIREEEKYISSRNYNPTILSRRNDAIDKLMDGAKGYTYGVDIPRCKFILKDEAIAARYLTVDGVFLYAQAIKDNFQLSFDLQDEYDERIMSFETLLQDLAEDNLEKAMNVWNWCLDTFMPHIQYVEYQSELTHSILLDLNNFIDEFPPYIVEYMHQKPSFIEKLIKQCIDTPWSVDDLTVIALKSGFFNTAKSIMECAFACKDVNVTDKARFIKTTIEACMNWDEVETIEAFSKHVFPLVYCEKDVRIKNKISRWEKEIADYIQSVEKNSDKYEYSRVNAWREKYREASLDPTRYTTEEKYLADIEERKHGWRRYCNKRYGVSPEDYETREAYDEAVRIASERETQIMREMRDPASTDIKNYRFCKISLQYPYKPYYYYFTGQLDLKVGDIVVVPFGKADRETEASVVSVGECLGCTLPCEVSSVKYVIRKKEL